MGFMDKLKGAMNAVTGNAAKVTFEFNPATGFPGEKINVKIVATSTGQDVKSKGAYVDLQGVERAHIKSNHVQGATSNISVSRNSLSKEFQIGPEFVLKANETKTWEGSFQIPSDVQPSFTGEFVTHEFQVRGRIEATGNDPDSGFTNIKIGLKS